MAGQEQLAGARARIANCKLRIANCKLKTDSLRDYWAGGGRGRPWSKNPLQCYKLHIYGGFWSFCPLHAPLQSETGGVTKSKVQSPKSNSQ